MDKMDPQELKKQLQAELQAANFQQMVEDMSEKCFGLCIKKPGSSLDNTDQKCLSNCMDRYIDSYNTVTKVFMARLSQQQ